MVEGARPSRRAIARSDSPAASPREISSRSPKLKTRGERVRGGGAIPPCPQLTRLTGSVGCASVAPTTTVECPARHPVQIALIASTVSRLYRLATDPPPMHVNLLRPPVETTLSIRVIVIHTRPGGLMLDLTMIGHDLLHR